MIKALRFDLDALGIEDFRDYSGHSFRSGYATDLFNSGAVTAEQIMRIGRWKNYASCERYFRGSLNAARKGATIFNAPDWREVIDRDGRPNHIVENDEPDSDDD